MANGEQYSKAVEEFLDKIISGDEFANTRRAYAMFQSSRLGYGDQVKRILGDHAYNPQEMSIINSEGEEKNYIENKLKETRKRDKNGNPVPGTGRLNEAEIGEDIEKLMQSAYQNKTFGELAELAGGDPSKVSEEYKDVAMKDIMPKTEEELMELYKQKENPENDDQELEATRKIENIQKYQHLFSQATQQIANYNIIQTLKETLPEAESDPGKNIETILGEDSQA